MTTTASGRQDTPTYVADRLSLRRRYQRVLRRHALRDVVRFGVLLAGDIGVVLAGATILGLLREVATGTTAVLVAALAAHGAGATDEILVALVAGLLVCGAYAPGDARRDPLRIFAGASLGVALPFWSYLWDVGDVRAVAHYGLASVALGLLIVLERRLIDRGVRWLWPVSAEAARVLIVGTAGDVAKVRKLVAMGDAREFVEAGHFDPAPLRGLAEPQALRRVLRAIRGSGADTIVLGGLADLDTYLVMVDAADIAGCQLFATVQALAAGGIAPKVVWRRGEPLLSLNRPALVGWQLILKRVLDVVGALLAMLLLSPVLLLVALLVKVTSRGPVFFRQTRIGLGGRPFTILKFRSMVADAERLRAALEQQSLYRDGRLFKLTRDPRVTPLGAVLRRTSLDELPQLWNVLVGEMSLVGPRPPLPSEVALYEAHHYLRFDVKPGITGPWQAGGRNRITDFEQVIELETSYIRDWTIWSDIAIILRTIPAVLWGRGAH